MTIKVTRINRRVLELSIRDGGETFVCRVNNESGLANALRKYSRLRST